MEIIIAGLCLALLGAGYFAYQFYMRLKQSTREIADLRRNIARQHQEAAQSKALFAAISNISYDLVFVMNEERVIIAVSKSALVLFNHPNPVGEKLEGALVSPELAATVSSILDSDEEPFEEQIRIVDRVYRVQTQLMEYNTGRFIGVALQDITQLVRLNRARRDMVANISHELRTPIANIRIIIDSLFDEADKPKRKESISSLKAIARETDSLLWLVQELLDLSMIESGQAIIRLVDTPLAELVESAVERMAEQTTSKNLKIACHIPEKLHVLCDSDLAKRVLVNLVHNAIKWSPKDETISISATESGDEVTISVFDNGPGVPDQQVDRIFERFYQVDASRSGQEGTGLGLAICRHIIEAHGGRIWAEGNQKGGGGRFLFTLLAVQQQEPGTRVAEQN